MSHGRPAHAHPVPLARIAAARDRGQRGPAFFDGPRSAPAAARRGRRVLGAPRRGAVRDHELGESQDDPRLRRFPARALRASVSGAGRARARCASARAAARCGHRRRARAAPRPRPRRVDTAALDVSGRGSAGRAGVDRQRARSRLASRARPRVAPAARLGRAADRLGRRNAQPRPLHVLRRPRRGQPAATVARDGYDRGPLRRPRALSRARAVRGRESPDARALPAAVRDARRRARGRARRAAARELRPRLVVARRLRVRLRRMSLRAIVHALAAVWGALMLVSLVATVGEVDDDVARGFARLEAFLIWQLGALGVAITGAAVTRAAAGRGVVTVKLAGYAPLAASLFILGAVVLIIAFRVLVQPAFT